MFYETFEKLCHDKGTSPSAVCIELGFSRTTSSYWKRSNGIPKREALEKIADYLGVSVDYLLGREQQSNAKIPSDLRISELVDKISALDDDQIRRLTAYVDGMIGE